MREPRIGIITQARMGSTRLPGKVLRTINGVTILEYHLRRLQASQLPVYIATTTLPEDEAIVELAARLAVPCFQGAAQDVLGRYFATATYFNLSAIVRVTSDCPLIDGKLLGVEVARYVAAADPQLYLSNGLVRSYPRGFDFEVFSYELLAEAHAHAHRAADREHVTPYLHQNRTGNVHLESVVRATDASRLRVTLDTPEDLQLLEQLIGRYQADTLSGEQLITLLQQHPELVDLNAAVEQKKYDFS